MFIKFVAIELNSKTIRTKQYARSIDPKLATVLCYICESEVVVTPRERGEVDASRCWFCGFQFDGLCLSWINKGVSVKDNG